MTLRAMKLLKLRPKPRTRYKERDEVKDYLKRILARYTICNLRLLRCDECSNPVSSVIL